MANFTGENIKADFGGFPYHIRRFSIKFRKPELDVTNSEGVPGAFAPALGTDIDAEGWQAVVRGNRRVDLTIEEATMDTIDNMFDGPPSLATDDHCVWKIYPAGRTGDYHYLPMMCTEISHDGDVKELQAITATFVSDGRVYLYGETKPAGA